MTIRDWLVKWFGDAFTMSLWIRYRYNGNHGGIMCDNAYSYGGDYFGIFGNYNYPHFQAPIYPYSEGLSAQWWALPNDVWTHLCGTFNRYGYTSLYTNGVLAGRTTAYNGSVNQNTNIFLGWDRQNSQSASGMYDEAKIWNRELSADEVKTIYNQR